MRHIRISKNPWISSAWLVVEIRGKIRNYFFPKILKPSETTNIWSWVSKWYFRHLCWAGWAHICTGYPGWRRTNQCRFHLLHSSPWYWDLTAEVVLRKNIKIIVTTCIIHKKPFARQNGYFGNWCAGKTNFFLTGSICWEEYKNTLIFRITFC